MKQNTIDRAIPGTGLFEEHLVDRAVSLKPYCAPAQSQCSQGVSQLPVRVAFQTAPGLALSSALCLVASTDAVSPWLC
jgi:hypothetical protein